MLSNEAALTARSFMVLSADTEKSMASIEAGETIGAVASGGGDETGVRDEVRGRARRDDGARRMIRFFRGTDFVITVQ